MYQAAGWGFRSEESQDGTGDPRDRRIGRLRAEEILVLARCDYDVQACRRADEGRERAARQLKQILACSFVDKLLGLRKELWIVPLG